MPKEFITPETMLRDSFSLAKQIHDSGFNPEVLLVLWRGGTPVGIVIHEFLVYQGTQLHHAVIKAESYTGIDQRTEPRIENMASVLAMIRPGARVLVVDDIFDTGRTMEKVKKELIAKTQDIRLAALYWKPGSAQVPLKPDYFIRAASGWIVFPHEIVGLTAKEIKMKGKFIHDLVLGGKDAT